MREIKFRVREKDSRKVIGYEFFNTILNSGFCYIDLRELKPGQEIGDLLCRTDYSEKPMLRPDGISLLIREQFTGLHDKNGKEIYEGDIVKTNHYDDKFLYHVIEFNNKGFYQMVNTESLNKSITDGSPALWIGLKDGGIVCGNIYENPELLEQDQ